MKSFIKYIGIIAKDENINYVEFSEGVNIITGKSSTGKSAILEVFDYCFGSSEFIIPEGVITEKAKFYFVVMKVSESYLVMGREDNPKKNYLISLTDEEFVNDVNNFTMRFFNTLEHYTLSNYRKEINRYFKIDIEDTDVDLRDREFRKFNAKKEAPSYRHFTSFMLQHQNLIANKHALFYRFDEKEKKDQVIEQFKIFLSFVDAEYFPLMQKIAEQNALLKQKEFLRDKALKYKESIKDDFKFFLAEYQIITNTKLFEQDAEAIISDPIKYLNILNARDGFKIITTDNSNIKKRTDLQTEYNSYVSNIRKTQNTISEIDISIIYAKEFTNQTSNIAIINNIEFKTKECKFCGNENVKLKDKQSKLTEAITWFNSEMKKSTYTIESFASNKKEYEKKLEDIKNKASKIKAEINSLDKVISDLEKNKSIEYQATKSILKVESFLETLQKNDLADIQQEIENINSLKKDLEERLKSNYNVESLMNLAVRQINQQMNIIGKKLEFEAIYKKNLNLKFDYKTFELYHQVTTNGKDEKKIYLRSMGSGANWLSSHVSLFTSLLYYFCSLKEKCLIPTILFLDQPSQVYFPTEIDKNEEFDGRKLNQLASKDETKYDDDINAVTNLFDQLVKFCDDTLKDTGIKPQIIITDHADNLKLKNADFETLVKARWRKKDEGFIKL